MTVALEHIGWTPDHTATKDPRVPVPCPWCRGDRFLLERLDGGEVWELVPVVCRGCEGAGSVRIERRRRIR